MEEFETTMTWLSDFTNSLATKVSCENNLTKNPRLASNRTPERINLDRLIKLTHNLVVKEKIKAGECQLSTVGSKHH